jgi:hypothetical protein
VEQFGGELIALGWVRDLLVAGSLATGDYSPGVSDLDLVAVTHGPVDGIRQARLTSLHRHLDATTAAGLYLGCAYVDGDRLDDTRMEHPTWTHGALRQRILSGITRAELVRYGYPVFGRSPRAVFPAMGADAIREAALSELIGYWTWATRRPPMWLNPTIADLGLTAMARGRHALRTGDLLTKTEAIERAAAPAWLQGHLRARRSGEDVSSPRLRTAWIAWRDAYRTTRTARARARARNR